MQLNAIMNFPITVKSEYDEETVKHPIPTVLASQPIAVAATSMHDKDVILSLSDSCRIHHDTSIANHLGNIAYKKLVNLNRDLLSSSKLDDSETLVVAQTIVSNIRAMGEH